MLCVRNMCLNSMLGRSLYQNNRLKFYCFKCFHRSLLYKLALHIATSCQSKIKDSLHFFIIERPLMFNVPGISNITSISNASKVTIQGYAKGLL